MSIWIKNKNPALLCLILLLGSVHNIYGLNHRQTPTLPAILPASNFTEWNSKELPNNTYEEALLNTGRVNKRVYFNNHDFLWYVLVESLHGHHGQHQPEVCYTGNGWLVDKRKSIIIPRKQSSINATKILLHRGNEFRWVVYWYSNGNMTTGSFYKRVFHHVWDDWSNKAYSAWTFHRVSLPVVEERDQSILIINSFIQEIKFIQKEEAV